MAPSEPGGIVLHKIDDNNNGLYLTSGSYVASDANVNVSSQVQTRLVKSLFSGSGMILLHAQTARGAGVGTVACAAYGAIHAYQLARGETLAVDNGHLVAWTAGMKYSTGLASRAGEADLLSNIMNSVTTGEGLCCFFEGPGTLYVQSHKPGDGDATTGRRRVTQGVNPVQVCLFFAFFGAVVGFFILVFVMEALRAANNNNNQNDYQRAYRGNYREF